MTKTYTFTARRKDDGSVIVTEAIMDPAGQGMAMMASAIRAEIAAFHPAAAGLEPDDIDIEISVARPNT